jgi:hypothetical protein
LPISRMTGYLPTSFAVLMLPLCGRCSSRRLADRHLRTACRVVNPGWPGA